MNALHHDICSTAFKEATVTLGRFAKHLKDTGQYNADWQNFIECECDDIASRTHIHERPKRHVPTNPTTYRGQL